MAALAAEGGDPGSPTSLLADHPAESPTVTASRPKRVEAPPPLPPGTLSTLQEIPSMDTGTLSGMIPLAEGASAFILEALHSPVAEEGVGGHDGWQPKPRKVAVKLARTNEGLIKADVEAEVRLLHTLSQLEGVGMGDEGGAEGGGGDGGGGGGGDRDELGGGSGSDASMAAGTDDGRRYVGRAKRWRAKRGDRSEPPHPLPPLTPRPPNDCSPRRRWVSSPTYLGSPMRDPSPQVHHQILGDRLLPRRSPLLSP